MTSTIDYDQLYVGGSFTAPAGRGTIAVHSPLTGELIGSVPEADETDIDRAVGAARRAFDDPQGWSRWTPAARAEVLERFAVAFESRGAEIARRVSIQNGMPIGLAHAFEGGFPPVLLRFYAQMMQDTPQEETRPGLFGGASRVLKQPVGVVAAIVPWNVPVAIIYSCLAAMA